MHDVERHHWLKDKRILFPTISNDTVSLVDQNNLQRNDIQDLIKIANEAIEHPEYANFRYLICDYERHKFCIIHMNKVIGFITPHPSNLFEDYWRVGSTFLTKNFRGKGITTQALMLLSELPQKFLAWIDDRNVPSIKTFIKAGYVKGPPQTLYGDHGHIYYQNNLDFP